MQGEGTVQVSQRTLEMCIVNPALVDGLAQLVGTQVEVMGRAGISWNTWAKIRSAKPIKLSVGRRLRSRMMASQAAVELLGANVLDTQTGLESLERIFLLPAASAD